MIFKQAQQVLDGTKTQTRRPVKPGEHAILGHGGTIIRVLYRKPVIREGYAYRSTIEGRVKWEGSRTYAIQPGRGKKSIGRIRITKIRREHLWDTTEEDARAEGAKPFHGQYIHYIGNCRTAFVGLWNAIYKKKPYRWQDNPKVWVLEFELVKAVSNLLPTER